MLERVISEVNDLEPDVVVVSGDLTEFGFRSEYVAAKGFLSEIECPNLLVVPGNHDSRNVGYVHFEDMFGPLDKFARIGPFSILCLDSSEPDLDEGHIGREKYHLISQNLGTDNRNLKIVVFHHHLIPIPGTGRERNILIDAGDFLKVLVENSVHIVLAGHRHVPNIWHVEGMYVINAGTACTRRVRGYSVPSYNILELDQETGVLNVYRKVPFEKKELILSTRKFENICKLYASEEEVG
jgi:3',5'-cyclic AMP phosphodiesterase CpdA